MFRPASLRLIIALAAREGYKMRSVLKHVRRLVTIPGILPIQSAAITSTTYLKVIDVPHIPAEPRVWLTTQRAAVTAALHSLPVGLDLSRYIKHTPRFMRTTPHTDTCVMWLDISDSVSGSNFFFFFFFFFFLYKWHPKVDLYSNLYTTSNKRV
jgi:hypothetical protein